MPDNIDSEKDRLKANADLFSKAMQFEAQAEIKKTIAACERLQAAIDGLCETIIQTIKDFHKWQ
jgi:hypothetical protein